MMTLIIYRTNILKSEQQISMGIIKAINIVIF